VKDRCQPSALVCFCSAPSSLAGGYNSADVVFDGAELQRPGLPALAGSVQDVVGEAELRCRVLTQVRGAVRGCLYPTENSENEAVPCEGVARRAKFDGLRVDHDALRRRFDGQRVDFPPIFAEVEGLSIEFPPFYAEVWPQSFKYPPICSEFEPWRVDFPPNSSEFDALEVVIPALVLRDWACQIGSRGTKLPA